MDEALGSSLKLDGVVGVIDSRNLERYLQSDTTAGDVRKQIAYADRILLNKQDLVSPDDMNRIEVSVGEMNPLAPRRRTSYSNVGDVGWLLHTDSFNMGTDGVALFYGSSAGIQPVQCLPVGADAGISLAAMQQAAPKAGLSFANETHSAMVLRTHHFSLQSPFDLQKLKVFLDFVLYSRDHARADDFASLEAAKAAALPGGPSVELPKDPSRPQIYRMKGMLHVAGETTLYTLQACHDVFDLDASTYQAGSTDDVSAGQSRIIVIGLNLDENELAAGFKQCCL
jgi:G3E family GTPase